MTTTLYYRILGIIAEGRAVPHTDGDMTDRIMEAVGKELETVAKRWGCQAAEQRTALGGWGSIQTRSVANALESCAAELRRLTKTEEKKP